MEATTMRKMMLAASLVTFAACGSVKDAGQPGGDDTGSAGSDMGSDTGSDAGMPEPTTCSAAADCGNGRACDVGSHQCVTGALTMEPSDFVVDGSMWWTNTSSPTLRGTFQGPTGAMVQARVGSNGVLAMLDGSSWSVTLPAGSIASSNTTVAIWMTDPSGGLVQLEQSIGLDSAPPSVTLKPSPVHDEAGDSIDFTSGQPVHAHVGTIVDLAANGCPTVHKYAYLMGPNDPVFGQQTSINPLAWKFTIQDMRVDASSLAYRVRDASNAIVLDWTTLPQPSNGVYTVELDRRTVAQLGTMAGNFHLEVRARDWAGLETVASWCWDHEPLAAPLQIGALAPAAEGLFAMSLPANSPISSLISNVPAYSPSPGLISYRTAPSIAEQSVVQYTAEPIRIHFGQPQLSGRYSKRVLSGYVPVGHGTGTYVAGDPLDLPAQPTITTMSGALQGMSVTAHVIDATTNQEVFPPTGEADVTIPARASNEAPHAYRIAVELGQVADLRPGTELSDYEYNVGSVSYTGTAPGATMSACTSIGGYCKTSCSCTTTIYRNIVALDTAHLDLDPLTISVQVSPDANVPAIAPPHVPASSFATGAMSWDAGDDDLGGY